MVELTRRPVALITGGAKRIGSHIALTLAKRGWDIAVHYRSSPDDASATVQQLHELGGRHCMIQADLTDETQTRQLFAQAVDKLGAVDAVVNNAAIFDYDDAASFTARQLQAHMLPNLAAPIVLAQALHQHVLERHDNAKAAVVNLLDQKLSNPNPDFLSYTLSKAALKSATVLLAQALAPQVRVAGVSPGLTLPSHLQTPEDFQKTHRMAPLERASTPQDIARAVVFLLESPAITGVDLIVDGGQHLVGMERDFSMI